MIHPDRTGRSTGEKSGIRDGVDTAPKSQEFSSASADRVPGEPSESRTQAGSTPDLNVDYHAQIGLQSQVYLDKFRIQLPLIIGLTAIVQLVLASIISGTPRNEWSLNSIVFTSGATTLSLLNYRKLRLFPGARRYAFILQAFLLPYLAMAGLLLWFRPGYSIPLLTAGFVTAIGLTWILNVAYRHPNTEPMRIVPGELTEQLLAEMPRLNHRICRAPADIETSNNLVVDLHADLAPEWERAIACAALRGASIYHVKQISESLTGRVRIDHLSENSFGMLRPNGVFFHTKDAVDRVGAAILLVLLSPLIAVAAIAVRRDSPGPAIFRQRRVGFRGETFTIYKLRTMRMREGGQDTRDDAITRQSDPRITRLGRFLRKTRIDELPQLVNVLKGELSLIGPRPEAIALSEWYEEELDFYPYRHIVKPGITGWAQINQGHVSGPEDVYRKLQYDFYYIKNFSLWLDLLIGIRTFHVMVTGHGSR